MQTQDERQGPSRRVTVLLVDDEPLYTDTVETLLADEGRIEVVGHAGDGAEAVSRAAAVRPDVVLMDVQMPRLDGVEATRLIRRLLPSTAIVMLTSSDARVDLDRATEAGAAGYLTKDVDGARIAEAILGAATPPSSGGRRTPLASAFRRLKSTTRVARPPLVAVTEAAR